MKLSETILQNHGYNYENEIETLIFLQDYLIDKLNKNKLLKEDREKLIEALEIIRLGQNI